MVEDKISNLINGLKTASKAGKTTTTLPYSKIGLSIMELLKKEGYVEDFELVEDGPKKEIKAVIKYTEGEPAIHDAKRISKFSCRIYRSSKDIRSVKRGYGMMAITTSEGVMSGYDAKKRNLGGEALFQLW